MDLVEFTVDEPVPGEIAAVAFADDGEGTPHEVIGRVIARHWDLISLLPGQAMATWNPRTAQAVVYPLTWEDGG